MGSIFDLIQKGNHVSNYQAKLIGSALVGLIGAVLALTGSIFIVARLVGEGVFVFLFGVVMILGAGLLFWNSWGYLCKE